MSSIRPHGCEILVTERGSFDARSVMVDIDRLYLQRRRERLARLVEVDLPRSGIIFLTEPGPSMFWNGAEIGVENLALFGPGRCISRLAGATSWGSMSLAADDMESVFTSYFGSSPIAAAGSTIITPPPGALMHLRSLHAAACKMAEASPKLSMQSASTCGLEQSLIQAMLACIDARNLRPDTTALQHHRLVIRRFCEIVAMHPLKPLHVPETSSRARCFWPKLASGLPEASRSKPHAVPAASSHASGAASLAAVRSRRHQGDRSRNKPRVLGTWTVQCQLPSTLWRITLHDPEGRSFHCIG